MAEGQSKTVASLTRKNKRLSNKVAIQKKDLMEKEKIIANHRSTFKDHLINWQYLIELQSAAQMFGMDCPICHSKMLLNHEIVPCGVRVCWKCGPKLKHQCPFCRRDGQVKRIFRASGKYTPKCKK